MLPETPYGKNCRNITVAEPVVHAVEASETLLRLPLYPDLTLESAEYICREIVEYFGLPKRKYR